jgi:hypothetical protein
MTPWSLLKAISRRFGGTCRLHLQDRRITQARNQYVASNPNAGWLSTDCMALYRGRQQLVFARCHISKGFIVWSTCSSVHGISLDNDPVVLISWGRAVTCWAHWLSCLANYICVYYRSNGLCKHGWRYLLWATRLHCHYAVICNLVINQRH